MASSVFAFLLVILGIGIGYSVPYLLTSLGEIYAEKSGVMNLSLEGTMTAGAFAAYTTAISTHNIVLGIGAAALVCAALGGFLGLLVITLKVNQNLAGLSLWLFGAGLSDFLFTLSYKGTSAVLSTTPSMSILPIPFLSSIPIIGSLFFNRYLIDYLAFSLVPVMWYFLFKTRPGLKVISAGEDPRATDAMGTNVSLVRYLAVIFGGAMAGIGGATVLLEVGLYQIGMVSGRGWISLGIATFSGFNPVYGLLASLLFGIISALGPAATVVGLPIPYEFVDMTPFIALIVVAVLIAKRFIRPASLGTPYSRE